MHQSLRRLVSLLSASALVGALFLAALPGVVSGAAGTCYPTGFVRDGIPLTAAQVGGTATGTIDAGGCNIGVYIDAGHPGSVTEADIFGANYFGVLVNGTEVAVEDSWVHGIGETPFNGAQHGNAIVFLNGASGRISFNTVDSYQKNGITVSGVDAAGAVPANPTTSASVLNNVVTGEGPVTYIAQNGIQISYGATALVRENTVSGNWYSPPDTIACGLLLYQANGVKIQANTLFDNEVNFCNFGRGGGHFKP
jgi:nitrous oxidase accessory protein NosD